MLETPRWLSEYMLITVSISIIRIKPRQLAAWCKAASLTSAPTLLSCIVLFSCSSCRVYMKGHFKVVKYRCKHHCGNLRMHYSFQSTESRISLKRVALPAFAWYRCEISNRNEILALLLKAGWTRGGMTPPGATCSGGIIQINTQQPEGTGMNSLVDESHPVSCKHPFCSIFVFVFFFCFQNQFLCSKTLSRYNWYVNETVDVNWWHAHRFPCQ